jgi:hypothetical protein
VSAMPWSGRTGHRKPSERQLFGCLNTLLTGSWETIVHIDSGET